MGLCDVHNSRPLIKNSLKMVPFGFALAVSALAAEPLAPDPRIEALIAKMTVAEKAGQLGVFSRPAGSDYNRALTPDTQISGGTK